MTTRVVIADDQELVRTGFRMILEGEADIDVVGEAPDGQRALEVAEDLNPDVILMDIRMPGVDGIEATRRINASPRTNGCRILILTTFDLDEYVFDAVRAGASGFLLKDSPAAQVIEAIRVIAAGDSLLAPHVTRRLIAEFTALAPRERISTSEVDALTPRELEVLRLVARGLSNSEIAAELVIGETTVKTHVAHILMKLDLRDRVQAVVFAYEHRVVSPNEGA